MNKIATASDIRKIEIFCLNIWASGVLKTNAPNFDYIANITYPDGDNE